MKAFFGRQFVFHTAAQKSRAIAQARGLSEVGNSIRQAILALAILSIRNNPQDLFLGEMLESAGFLAMSFIAPFFIDRLKRMKSLIIADLLSLLNSGILIYGVIQQDLVVLWAGSFLMTFISSFYNTSLFSVTAQYSGSEKNQVRIGLSFLQQNILIGALVGLVGSSFALPHLPLHWFLLFDALTFLLSSFWVFWVARKDLALEVSRKFKYSSYSGFIRELTGEWMDGFKSALIHPGVRRLLIGNCLTCFGYGILESTIVSMQKLVLGFSHSMVTGARALNRITAIFGSIFVSRNSKGHGTSKIWKTQRFLNVGAGVSVLGTSLMSVAIAPSFIVANSIHNFGWSFVNPTIGAEMAQETPKQLLGRVQAFRSLLINLSILLGNAFVLLLSPYIGVQYFFVITSSFFVVAILVWKKHY